MQNKTKQKQSLEQNPPPGTVYHRTNNPKKPWQLNTLQSSQQSAVSAVPAPSQEDQISEAEKFFQVGVEARDEFMVEPKKKPKKEKLVPIKVEGVEIHSNAEDFPNDQDLIPKRKVTRIQMKFIKLMPDSTLPRKMPVTIVYWNRCQTRVNPETQMLVTEKQLQIFQDTNFKLHDYPRDRDKCAHNFPHFNNKDIWQDHRREKYLKTSEQVAHQGYDDENPKDWAQEMKPRLVEGVIRIDNTRNYDVFFNSNFESGNLRQAFMVPQEADLDTESDEEKKIPLHLTKEERDIAVAEIKRKRLKRVDERKKQELEELLHQSSGESDDDDPERKREKEIQKEEAVNEDTHPQHIEDPAPTQDKPKKKKKRRSEYNLYLQDDTQSDGSSAQWYYFSAMNVKAGTIVKLNLCNLTKRESLYGKGLRPYVFSTKKNQLYGKGWHHAGNNVKYEDKAKAQLARVQTLDIKWFKGDPNAEVQAPDAFRSLRTLTFEYKFDYDFDTVFFAHYIPYTYSDLCNYLCKLECNKEVEDRMRIDYICNSLGRLPVYGLTITSKIKTNYVNLDKEIFKWQKYEYYDEQNDAKVKPKKAKQEPESQDEEQDNKPQKQSELIEKPQTEIQNNLKNTGKLSMVPEMVEKDSAMGSAQDYREEDFRYNSDEEARKPGQIREKFYKKVIFITARVHPGESQSSFIAEALINYLISDDPEALEIRKKFVIKIIPMLNSDGVKLGNYRHGLLGVDLNRRWSKPSKFLHPEIYYVKSMIRFFNKKCKQPEVKSGGVVLVTDIHGHSKNMDVFMYSCLEDDPLHLHTHNTIIRAAPDAIDRTMPVFNTNQCKFSNEASKEDSARIVLFREFGILNSHTLECSYYGSEYLTRTKQIYMALFTKEQLDVQHQRYKIGPSRKDISFDQNTIAMLGIDFIRGINLGSKRLPLLKFWFRVEPKIIVEITKPKDDDPDWELREMEQRWKPIGGAKGTDKYVGIGDQFTGGGFEYIHDGPVLETAEEKIARIKGKKKLDKKKINDFQVKQNASKTRKETGSAASKRSLNSDLDDVQNNYKKKAKKSKFKKQDKKNKTSRDNKNFAEEIDFDEEISNDTSYSGSYPVIKAPESSNGKFPELNVEMSQKSHHEGANSFMEQPQTWMRISGGSPVKQSSEGFDPLVVDSKQTTYQEQISLPQIAKLAPSKQVTLEINITKERKTKLERDDTFKLESQMTIVESEATHDFGYQEQQTETILPRFIMPQTMLKKQPVPLTDEEILQNKIISNYQAFCSGKLLALEPVILSSAYLSNISQVKMSTLKRKQSPYQSPRGSPKSKFPPAGAVFSQRTMLENPDLAERKDLNFMCNISPSPSSKTIFHDSLKTLSNLVRQQQSIQHLIDGGDSDRYKKNRIRDGFDMSTQRTVFRDESIVHLQSYRELQQKQKMKAQIVLKPLNNSEWIKNREQEKAMLRKHSPRNELSFKDKNLGLASVLGTLKIKNNQIQIALPSIKTINQTPQSYRISNRRLSDVQGFIQSQKIVHQSFLLEPQWQHFI